MDLRRRLGEALDRAATGERIVIERDRRPLAVLISYEDALRLDSHAGQNAVRTRDALDRLEDFARRMAVIHEGPDAATAIRQERDRGHAVDR